MVDDFEIKLTQEQFLKGFSSIYGQEPHEAEWDKEQCLCYRASVMDSPRANKIINENADEICSTLDCNNVAKEYFDKYPEKLTEVRKVASDLNIGEGP